MIQLTKEEIQKIETEALELYPVQMDCIYTGDGKIEYDYNEEIRDAYIAAATSRQLRIKELEEVLMKIAEQHTCKEQRDDPEGNGDIGDVEYGYDAIIELAREKLNYKP